MAQGNLQFRTNKSDDGRNLKLTIFFCGSYRVIFSKWFEPRSITLYKEWSFLGLYWFISQWLSQTTTFKFMQLNVGPQEIATVNCAEVVIIVLILAICVLFSWWYCSEVWETESPNGGNDLHSRKERYKQAYKVW